MPVQPAVLSIIWVTLFAAAGFSNPWKKIKDNTIRSLKFSGHPEPACLSGHPVITKLVVWITIFSPTWKKLIFAGG